MALHGEESVNGKAVSDDIEASYEYIKEEELGECSYMRPYCWILQISWC